MTDHAPETGSPSEPAVPAATTRQGEARERAARGLLALVPLSLDAAVEQRRASGHPLTPDLSLIDPARLDVMFDPASLRHPVLRCLLDRVAAILDGVAVLQTPAMVIMERSADGDLVGVPLRPEVRPEDHDGLDRALALGGVTVLPARGSRPRRMLVALRGGGELLGYLVATSRSDGPWPRAVTARAARTLALVLMVSADALADREHRRTELFGDLLAALDDDRLPARAVALGHDLSRPHRAFAFAADPDAAAGLDLDALADLVSSECATAAPGVPTALVGRSDGRVLAFVPQPTGRTPEPDPTRFATTVVAAATGRGWSVSAGIGAVATAPAGFAAEARHAVRALGVLATTGRSRAVIAYDELGVYGLLVHSDDHERMDEFVRRWIGPLLDYDREHNSELVRTLGTLLDEPTLAEAADALFVHTSTLKYRVKRIEEILGAPIRDPRAAFHLQLATTIHRVRSGIGAPDPR